MSSETISLDRKYSKINCYNAVKVSDSHQTQLRITFPFILLSLVLHRFKPSSTLQKCTHQLH